MPLGRDPQRHIDDVNQFLNTGFDRVYVHQVGWGQDAFFKFYAEKIVPGLRSNSKKLRLSRASALPRHNARVAIYGLPALRLAVVEIREPGVSPRPREK